MKRASAAILSLLALGIVFCAGNAFAASTGSANFSVDVADTILELTVPNPQTNPIVIDLNPTMTGTAFGTANVTISAATNNQTGYTITMTPESYYEDTALVRTELVSGEEDYRRIGALEPTTPASTGYTEDTFTPNAWGYRILSNTNYYGIDENNPTISHPAWTTDAPTNGTTHNLTLAAKVNATTVSGSYETTLNFSAVTNNVPLISLEMSYGFHGKQKVTVNNKQYYKMQDMSAEICSYTNEIPSELEVVDVRDNNIYWIANLADGHCWMTQNLDLNLSNQTALVHATSDIGWGSDTSTMSWLPERSTITVTSTTTNSWVDDIYNPYSADVGVRYYTDTWFNNACNSREGCNYLGSTANGKFSNSPYPGNGEHGRIGNYYNWTAAIASNDSTNMSEHEAVAQNSICPAGWRLPTAYTYGSEKNNEFKNLLEAYDPEYTSDAIILGAPLYYTRAGNFYEKVLSWAGNSGSYWSSVTDSDQEEKRAQYMYFRNDSVAPTYAHKRIVGWNIRCIAR